MGIVRSRSADRRLTIWNQGRPATARHDMDWGTRDFAGEEDHAKCMGLAGCGHSLPNAFVEHLHLFYHIETACGGGGEGLVRGRGVEIDSLPADACSVLWC